MTTDLSAEELQLLADAVSDDDEGEFETYVRIAVAELQRRRAQTCATCRFLQRLDDPAVDYCGQFHSDVTDLQPMGCSLHETRGPQETR